VRALIATLASGVAMVPPGRTESLKSAQTGYQVGGGCCDSICANGGLPFGALLVMGSIVLQMELLMQRLRRCEQAKACTFHSMCLKGCALNSDVQV
jgi:hypothetical protein